MALAAATLAHSEAIPEVAPEIVSAWKLNGAGEDALLIFRHDGTYAMADGSATEPGMERGTFVWDKATSAFSVTTLRDTNGDGGLSHPDGITTLNITGDILTYTVAEEGSFTFSRVVNTASTIVGSWFIPGEHVTLTFLEDGRYYHTEESNRAPDGYDGMERGTYSWNSGTGALSRTVHVDTNGDIGLSNPTPAFTATVSGNKLTFFDGEETYHLRRITPIVAPLSVEIDFVLDQFANYRQTSAAAPALLPVPLPDTDDFPFQGEAHIEDTVGGTGGTLTITGQPARDFEGDDDGWEIENGFATLADLNAASAFPNNSTYLFARTGGSATLSFPAGGAFPAAPKITGDDDNGSWTGGNHVLGQNQTLIWDAHTNYDPTALFTFISMTDQETGEELIEETVIQGDFTSYDFSGKLTPGSAYDVELGHTKIASTTTAGTGPFAGKLGYALYTSETRFTLMAPDGPASEPIISEQPKSIGAEENSNVSFRISTETDDPNQTYQWYKDEEEIIGQTGNSLNLFSIGSSDYSQYAVAVTNAEGTVTSDVATLGAPYVSVMGLNRRQLANQQTATSTAASGANFSVYVEGSGISPSFPSATMRISRPDNSLVSLNFDEYRWELDNDFASAAAMQAAYPDGNYQIRIGGDTVPLTLGSTSYPVQPVVTSSVGTWQAGKLQLTAAQAAAGFTLTTNTSNGGGTLDLQIYDAEDDDIYGKAVDGAGGGKTLQASISGGTLEAGNSYSVEVEFDEVTGTADASAFPWSTSSPQATTAFALLSSTTFITIEVIADSTGTAYPTWQAGFFNPTQLANPAISGDDVDFDNDGVPNLLEYLLGGNPTLPNSGLLPSITKAPGSGNLVFTYKRKIAATGVAQVIEHTANLSPPWTPAVHGQNGVTIVTAVVSGDATAEQVTATIPSVGGARFVRLKASR